MDISNLSAQPTALPTAFPNCCLSLSTSLLSHLSTLLPKLPNFTLSIGSGSGLLEAMVTHLHPDVSIEGVEVNSSVNLYIAEEDMNVVSGTWDLLPRAAQAKAWMFVYPREPKLVTKYIEMYGDCGEVEMILWLGPRADWADYEESLRNSVFCDLSVQDVGLAEFEMLVTAKRPSR
ncbi:uncharacterized protein BDV17DRAFT_249169 [Aspergillus undulatus]|uniref:uncharacterized protein n=1 Tax=Aspergillus undulatus TaxID=1810928 RepID=UPI003CCE41C3